MKNKIQSTFLKQFVPQNSFYLNSPIKKNYSIFLPLLFLIVFIVLAIIPAYCQTNVNQENTEFSSVLDSPQPTVYIAKFTEPGCHDCEKAARLLEQISFQYTQIEIKSFDVSTPEGVALAEQLGEVYQVPEYERLLVPLVYVGDDYFLRDKITYDHIINAIEEIRDKDIMPPWERAEEDEATIQDRLIERFRSFGIGAIALSGLIDGINPCAFATIIFFISYLTLMNRKGKELLWVGGIFTFAVFLTYFLIGAGALRIVTTLAILPMVRKIFIFTMAGVSVILGYLSLSDYLKFKKTGQTTEASLQLPPRIKKMIHSTIRYNVRTRHFIIMAAATGFFVSILELACTGQIYLPTLIFISNVPELRANALLYLLLYNLMFVVPLILVFLFTYWGTSSQQWAELTKKNFGKMKVIMAILFFGLAILLVTTGLIF